MVEKNFEAYRNYESAREGIEKEVLSYFLDRVRANEEEIKELIEIKKEAISYEEIIKINEEETEKIEYSIQEKEKAKEKIVSLEDEYFEKEVENSKEPNQIAWKGEYEEILKRR